MGTKTAVIDTNVIISAFGWGGAPMQAIAAVIAKGFELVVSYQQLNEIQKVFTYERITLSAERKAELLAFLHEVGRLVELKGSLDIIKEDPSDNIILEAAVEHNAAFIITGDKHLLKLKQFRNVQIVTPSEFLRQ